MTAIDLVFPVAGADELLGAKYPHLFKVCIGMYGEWGSSGSQQDRVYVLIPYSITNLKLVGVHESSKSGLSHWQSTLAFIALVIGLVWTPIRSTIMGGESDDNEEE